MASPVFSKTLHDIGINNLGYVLPPDARVMRQDAVPATSRAALGESSYDLFQADSFYAQATFAGGAGQARLSSTDSYLSGVCDSRWAGHLFPARKLAVAASTGGTESFMFHRGANMYGFVGTNIEQFGTTNTFAAGGLPRHQPAVDANDYVYYVTAANQLYKWMGTGAASDITANLGVDVTPYVVVNYHRYLWCLATRAFKASPRIVQTQTRSSASVSHRTIFNTQPVAGNLLIMTVSLASNISAISTVSDGWILAHTQTQNTANEYAHTHVYYKAAEARESRVVEVALTTTQNAYITLMEWEGMDASGILNGVVGANTDNAVALAPGSLAVTENDALVLMISTVREVGATVTPATGYSQVLAYNPGGAITVAIGARTLTAAATETPSATSSLAAYASNVLLAFKGNDHTADVVQFVPFYSADTGVTWAMAFSDLGTGVEYPTAAHAAGGLLWFTTPRGLYQMGVEDKEFGDGLVTLNVFLRGKIDSFNLPSGSANVGLWIDDWNGGLYYGVGQTVRSFPMGAAGQAEGRQIWPTEDWGTAGGNVAAVRTGEGGVYFGAAGTLWCYNQRGFHPLAAQATASVYNFLYWHDGKLYVKSDPASYYDFIYPSMRPDTSSTAAANFETSYWVSSLIDFEKTDVFKHLSQFQTAAEFSTTTDSGTITLSYRNADTGLQPDRLGGGATSLTWIDIGTHSVTDGNIKTYTPTPIKAKSIYLRLTWTVGTSGYAIPQAVIANGRSIMPPVKRMVLPIWLASDAHDKAGNQMYAGSSAAVWTALDELNDLRNGDNTFPVSVVEPDGGTSTYTVTAEQLQDSIIKSKKIARAVAGDAQLVVLQLPGTTVTETRP